MLPPKNQSSSSLGGNSGGEETEESSAETTPIDLPAELHNPPQHYPGVLAELLCTDEAMGAMSVMSTDSGSSSSGSIGDDNDNDEDGKVRSYYDPNILHHPDMLDHMRFLERTLEKVDYFAEAQAAGGRKMEILPYMRKVVGSWMLEVCEEQGCDEAVFPLACGILDRLLATCFIKKEQLQLVACVCLLLASKTRQSSHFSLELLAWYTDHSVDVNIMRNWELMILAQLGWDINIITPIDFVDALLVRCVGVNGMKETQLIRRHAITFIALCTTEPRFVNWDSSLLCAATIHTALKGLRRNAPDIVERLAKYTRISVQQLHSMTESVDNVISTAMAGIQQTAAQQITAKTNTTTGGGSLIQGQKQGFGSSPDGTPTDVQEIVV